MILLFLCWIKNDYALKIVFSVISTQGLMSKIMGKSIRNEFTKVISVSEISYNIIVWLK